MTGRVAIVGGGLAGLSAAVRLADGGCTVTLLESKPRLGGLTHSFRRGDIDVDNGQHVFLRCCTSYRSFLDRLGVTGDTVLQERLDVPVVHVAAGRRARLRRDPLPSPLHLFRSLATYGVLPPRARMRALRAAAALRALDRDAAGVDDRSFGSWLTAHGQTADEVAALWDLVGVATLNLRAQDASLAQAAMVFQVGLLESPDAADIGWSRVPLQRLHGDAAAAVLDRAGARVLTRAKVTELLRSGHEWVVRSSAGDVVCDAVVVATDHVNAERLLPPDAIGLVPGWSSRLAASPIVNVHVVLDRVVMSEPFLAAADGPVQWVFDRTRQSGIGVGQYLALSLSAADEFVEQPVAALRTLLLPELQRLLPAMAAARIIDFFVTREPQATFRPSPGSAAYRPRTTTRSPGLVLAGAYTATGWPATMESAVRSGDAAAAALLSARELTTEVVPA